MRVNGLFGWVRHNDARSAVVLLCFALLSQPMAMVVLFFPLVFWDPAHAPWYSWAGYATRYAPIVAAASIGLFLAQMWWHVNTVRKDLAFRFVDDAEEPRLCGLVEPLAIAAGVKTPYVGVIESPAMNAFACGVTRNFAVAVFTRGIIDGLDDDELAAVIAHELVHIRNGDTRLIAAANIFMRNLSLLNRHSGFKPTRYRQVAMLLLIPILFPVYLGVAILSHLFLRLGYASRLLISSAREFIADAEAVRLTQHPAALVSALRRIQGQSAIAGVTAEQDAMMIDGAAQGALATHPCVQRRIEAIVAMTGAMALEDRPRRDTRSEPQRRRFDAGLGGNSRENWVPSQARQLAGIAATAAAPRQSGFGAFRSVGAGGELGIFGLRRDIAAAMLATFCTAALMHHGDILGFLGRMSHALDRPDANTQWLIDKARACQLEGLTKLFGGKASSDACAVTPDFIPRAKILGVNLLPDGRMLSDRQLALLSPDELDEGRADTLEAKGVFRSGENRDRSGPATALASAYPLPLHDAWTRLAHGDLGRYLRHAQCGILIHVHTDWDQDRSVTWRITSEGEERIRFTVTLAPDGETATKAALDVTDRQPRKLIYNSHASSAAPNPVVYRPALRPPLRPAFSEAVAAMLEDRLYIPDRVRNGQAWAPGDEISAGLCGDQFNRAARWSQRVSIHDPEQFR